MLDDLRRSLAAQNADQFRRAAHSLKSNSNTFGALTLGAMAKELELTGLAPALAANGATLDALDAGVRARRRGADGAQECMTADAAAPGCWSSTTTRSTGCC